ncbi:MAG: hypothetical protein ACR2F1_07935 [Nitrososphaeraceae archaeon]
MVNKQGSYTNRKIPTSLRSSFNKKKKVLKKEGSKMDYHEKSKCFLCGKIQYLNYKEKLENDKIWQVKKCINCGYHHQEQVAE